ncbi:Endoplasmic reticulum-derived transport vesicle ERV46 [Rhizoctonia solani]|uniref:Endoplasmic reticulum-derived transport vesicle ERV46 n=1 Tax=Rhizoctonia solani TaxID=456999 RepID=A0A8H7IAK2_9AGAM|nr:Endoplasmic reticulum-derived transport vesicle ERV46 [Rhizoctonia solani]
MPVALRCVLSSSYHQALLYLPASISANNMARGLLRAYVGLDGFGKTLEDVKVRTRTGGFLTLISMGIILIFTIIEIIDYRRIGMASDIIVDVSRGEQISVNMNITFPRVPCYLLSLDITDVSGDIQQDVSHHILKTRLEPSGAMIHENTLNYRIKSEPKGGCCQTCESVRQAYLTKGWSFDDPNMIEQCVAEHWTTYIHEQNTEGCRLSGRVRINKVTGNFHFLPVVHGNHHDFGHYIHEFHFEGDREIEDRWREGNRGTEWRARVGSDKQPLDGLEAHVSQYRSGNYDPEQPSNWMIQYFLKVVSTEVRHLDGDLVCPRAPVFVTNYERDIRPGHEFDPLRDANGIKTTHGYEGLPGAFFHYEISPMLVVHTETKKSFAHLVTS